MQQFSQLNCCICISFFRPPVFYVRGAVQRSGNYRNGRSERFRLRSDRHRGFAVSAAEDQKMTVKGMAHRRGVFGTVRDVSAFQPDQCSAGNTDLNPGGVRDGKTALFVLHGDFNLENLARRSVLIFRKKAGNGASGTESPGNPVGLHFQYAWSTDGRKLIAGVSFPAAHGDQRAGRVNRKGSRMERYLPADTVFAGRFLPDSETFPFRKSSARERLV